MERLRLIAALAMLVLLGPAAGALAQTDADAGTEAEAEAEAEAPRDYLITSGKPDQLYVIDAAARQVVRTFTMPGTVKAQSLVVSPDGSVAYNITEHDQSVTGFDLETGEIRFYANLSLPGELRSSVIAIALSADGSELYSYDLPTRLGREEYEVLDTRLSVFRTNAGMAAVPVREFPMMRRIGLLMTPREGRGLYALGWDLYRIDPDSGAVETILQLSNWQRENLSPPDMLSFWDLSEQSGLFLAPYVAQRLDLPPDDPAAFVFGLVRGDLGSGTFTTEDMSVEPQILFTVAAAPDRKYAFASFLNLVKIDLASMKAVASRQLGHTQYFVQVSSDGQEVYLGGNLCDIPVYSAETLEKIDQILLPECHEMGAAPLRIIRR